MRPYLRPVSVVAAVALVLMASACSVPTAGTVGASAAGVNAPTTASATAASSADAETSTSVSVSTPASEPSSSTQSAASNQAAFGETYRWTDGLEVTVSTPTPFTPGQYAAAEPATAYLSYTVTIVNNTGAVYEPALFFTSVQSGDQEADQVFDSENNLTGSPSTAILDGRQSTFTIGFGVSNPDDVVMEVTPGFDYDDVYFTSAGAGSAPASATEPVTSLPEPAAGDASAASNQAAFGETYRWTDGLEVTVSTPTPFTPGQYAAAEPATAYLSYTVTIVNNTGAVYEPALFFTSVQSGDQEADQVFDSENNLTGSPSTAILDGRQSTFTIGFGVSNPDDVVMEVTPGFDYDDVYFTS